MESEYAKLSVPEEDPVCGPAVWGERGAREYGEMFSQMQGKRVAFAGDSLMDMVVFPFLCSAPALGWSVVDEPVGKIPSRSDEEARILAKRLTKPGMEPIVVAHMRFWHFLRGERNVKVEDPFNIPLTPPTFDVLFLNMAHSALDWPPQETWGLSLRLLLQADREATHIGRVVFIGHPPQHFDTPSGGFEGPQSVGVPCACRDEAALEQQRAFRNNAFLEAVVEGTARGSQWPYNELCRSDLSLCKAYKKSRPNVSRYANPWHDYKDLCARHLKSPMGAGTEFHSVDCTHFPYDDYELHAPFLKKMLDIAGL
jgi:hypothetical protein